MAAAVSCWAEPGSGQVLLTLLLPLPGMYSCPCYYYPNRAGTSGRPSFVIGIDLRSGSTPADHWIKRGTALLMSLDT